MGSELRPRGRSPEVSFVVLAFEPTFHQALDTHQAHHAQAANLGPKTHRPFARRFTVILALTLALFARAPVSQATEQLVEGIAAQVGNDIVLASEVLELSGPIEERMKNNGAPAAEILKMRRDALERLIETKLLSSVVERLELGADRDEIDSAIAAIASDNNLSIEQLLSSITGHGLTIEEYRNKIQGEIERSKVVNAMVRSRVQINAEEVQALYDDRFGGQRDGGQEVYLRHIVVLSEGGRIATSSEDACAAAADARNQIAAGDFQFREVAARISDMNPEQGGELGWIHRSDLADWMLEALDEMEVGQLSEVISMPFGCNLLELVDRRNFQSVTFEQAEPELRNMLFQQKTEVEYTNWLDILRGQTFIERKAAFGG
jgi:peptidyl-prolyl cis-trans isomerase SurA